MKAPCAKIFAVALASQNKTKVGLKEAIAAASKGCTPGQNKTKVGLKEHSRGLAG